MIKQTCLRRKQVFHERYLFPHTQKKGNKKFTTAIQQSAGQMYCYSMVQLIKYPLNAYIGDVLKIDAHVSYYVTNHFNYYGIVNSGAYKIVIVPTMQTR